MNQGVLRVLMVDDDEDDFLIVRDLLSDASVTGYRVDWASSSRSGLEALRRGDFDVCLVDQRLGPERGLDLIRDAADEGLCVPMILLTGADSRDLDEAALHAGAADYLVKGALDAEALSRSVRYAVEGARLLLQLQDGERRYRLLFEENPGPMWIYDAESLRLLDVNEAATREYGYTRDEFLGLTLLDLHAEEDRESLLAFCQEGGSGYRAVGIWRHRHKDGSIRYMDVIRHEIEFIGQNARIILPRDVTGQVEAQRALEAAHAQQRRLLEDTVDAIVVTDTHGLVQFANAAAGALFGSAPDLLQGERLPYADELLRNDGAQVEILTADKPRRVVEPRLTDTQWNGQHACLLVLRDQTDLHHHRQQLTLLERAIESSLNGVVICDARAAGQPLIYANAAFERITGYTVTEALGRNMNFLQGDDSWQPGVVTMRRSLAAQHEHNVLVRNYRKDGRPFWNHVSISPVRSSSGEVTHFIGILNDITDRIEAEDALARAEKYDAVTGLERYPLFAARMVNTLDQSDAEYTSLTLLFIDLDRFHTINESMGHGVGDFTLRRVAERIGALVGESGEVVRYAGDEFLAAINGLDEREAVAMAEALRAAISEPIESDGFRVYLTASIGLSRFPDHGARWVDLLRRAELAMSQAKQSGRDQLVPFAIEQMQEVEARLDLGRHLRDALRAGEFRLNYQPILGMQPQKLHGFEALLRWHSAVLGEVSPARFIPVAESLGLMPEIGLWVLREACHQIRSWLDAGRDEFTVSVNVSALQLLRPEFLPQLTGLLAEFRIPPGVLDVELTESVLMENVEATRDTLSTLRRIGVSISLDDFGTGYSSLAYLRELPLDRLKIDRSFVKDLPENGGAVVIARTIVGIAHELQLKVCAEGVETEEQRAFLVDCGCDMAQGYLLGRPVPPDQIADSMWNGKRLLHDIHTSPELSGSQARHQR